MALRCNLDLPLGRVENAYVRVKAVIEDKPHAQYFLTYHRDQGVRQLDDGELIHASIFNFGHPLRDSHGVRLDLPDFDFGGASPRNQAYTDLKLRFERGLLPKWLTNLRNEDGTPFLEAPGKPQADSASAVPIDAATDQALASDEDEPFSAADDIAPLKVVEADLAQTREELLIANERIAELESREPEVRIERVEVEPDPPAAPYVPDFTLIPDALAKFAEADETAADFRNRLKRLWQRFGIADGENFPGGGEPLTGEEKIRMREIDIVLNSDEGRTAGLLQWLDAEDQT